LEGPLVAFVAIAGADRARYAVEMLKILGIWGKSDAQTLDHSDGTSITQ
jgi:hypothetical protein